MKALLASFVLLAAWRADAGTVIVSREPGVTLDFGDELAVQFLSPKVSSTTGARITLSVITSPTDLAVPVFDLSLQSFDGSVSLALHETLAFAPGYVKSSGYSGAVSVGSGSFTLSAAEALQVFGSDRRALLVLNDIAGELRLGLPHHSVSQLFYVSVTTDSRQTGAPVQKVSFEQGLGLVEMEQNEFNDEVTVPEPAAAAMLLLGLTGCWAWRRRARNTGIPS